MSFCWFWIAYCLPYTGDDWDWGLAIGLEQLKTANLNSRYAGNLLEVIMTRSEWVKTILLGGVYTAIPLSITTVSGKMQPIADDWDWCSRYLGCNLLVLLMKPAVWAQSYGWIAGAANYVISGLLLFWYIGYVWDSICGKRKSVRQMAGALLLSFSMMLFLENLTIAVLVCTAAVFLWCLIRKKPGLLRIGCVLAGNAIGIWIMFSSSLYGTLQETGEALDGVRSMIFLPEDPMVIKLQKCAWNFLSHTIPELWEIRGNVITMVILCCLCVLLWKSKAKSRWLPFAGNCLWVGYVLSNRVMHWDYRFFPGKTASGLFHAAVGLALFVLVLWSLYVVREQFTHPAALACVWIMVPWVVAPMAAVAEYGPRMFAIPDLLMAAFAAMLLGPMVASPHRKQMTAALALLTLALAFNRGNVYREIRGCTQTRLEIISGGQQTIVLPAYPHGEYLWMPDPVNPLREQYFREFYRVPENAELLFEGLQ